MGNCTPSTAAADDYDDNYQVICGNGTDKLDAPLKIYSLQISQVSASDKSLWWCQIENTSSLSNTYRMEPRSKYTLLTCCFGSSSSSGGGSSSSSRSSVIVVVVVVVVVVAEVV